MASFPDDNELLLLFRDPVTKERGYTQLVKKYQEKIYWHIRRLVVDHDDANDVMQNVFIKVWKGLDQFREDARFYTWLYRIATNESLSFLEKEKKKASVSFEDISLALSEKLAADKDFDLSKIEWKLQVAIQKLPEKQKLVFSLRYYEGS
jgi:RNA polymerase sigma-70 factor (ECF subfamily)